MYTKNNYIRKIKIVAIYVFVLFLSIPCRTRGTNTEGTEILYGETEILWDNFQVPHIFTNNFQEMYYAIGWAQMNNHANLMLKLYGQSRGRAAEYWGSRYLNLDKKIHLFNVPEQALLVYEQLTSEYKEYIDAFTKGVNDYAERFPDFIDEQMNEVLPVLPVDVIGHIIRVISLEFLASEDILLSNKSHNMGSNAIAVAPSKSFSGNSMLLINPHLPWSGFSTLFETHLNIKGLNIYGVALIGTPTIMMGFNDFLGWAHTINPIDASDRYELILKENGYLLDGEVRQFKTKTKSLNVKQENGTIINEIIEFKYSKHGPVIWQNEQKAYAVRIAGFGNTKIMEQYHKMSQAKNINEFENALKMMQLPMFNIIYADKVGNIFYLFNGNIPVRDEGDFAFWNSTINGTETKYIWDKIHSYNELPKCLNPISGFVQNCNDPPWTCTFPTVLDSKKFPPYMSSSGANLRAQRAINLLIKSPVISYDQLIDIKHNTGMEAADRLLDDLLASIKKHPNATSLKAGEILKAWDKKTDPKSRGAVLFANWWDRVRSDLFEIPWSDRLPNTTPDGIKDPKKAVELLVLATNEISQKYDSIDVAWGDIHRLVLNNSDYPANGGPGHYGILRTFYFDDKLDNLKYAEAGETFIAAVEFGEKINARVLLGYGNATQPNQEQNSTQLEMLYNRELRPVLLEKDEIFKNITTYETLQIKFNQ